VRDAGTLSATVFELQPGCRYVITDSIVVPAGSHLTIVAPEPGTIQNAAPPQLLCSPGSDDFQPTRFEIMFHCYGDITLKDLWILFANTVPRLVWVNITIEDDPAANATGKGEVAVFENVIFDYSTVPWDASGAVGIRAKHFKGIFKNCYWKNCADPHLRYYGRAISFPFMSTDFHGDSVVFENCTFANMGYVLMQEQGEYFDYVKFNHCTFVNVVGHSLESGWWKTLTVTNCVFANTFMFGSVPMSDGNEPNGGTLRIDSLSASEGAQIYAFPFTEQDRRILFTHSSYSIEKWLTDWMSNNPASLYWLERGEVDRIPIPQPMMNRRTMSFFDSNSTGQKVFPHMNRAQLHDSANPGFIFPPTDTSAIKSFVYRRWWDSSDTLWAWKPQNSFNQVWPLEEKLAYTNPILLNGGMGRFPLGDLYHWFPDKYTQWKTQASSEYARIDTWLNTGVDPGGTDEVQSPSVNSGPWTFTLNQNYPNPFNPTTHIEYSVGRSGYVSLKVFNILGEEVATLHAGYRSPGNYAATFDGRRLASGVYFYRLRAGEFVSTRKLLLIK
jgi:hypothetical protein